MENEIQMINPEWLKARLCAIADTFKSDHIFIDRIVDEIDNAPAVDVVPVVHGFWKSKGNKLECSVCSHRAYLGTENPGIHAEEKKVRNYCFHCGAKMNSVRVEHGKENAIY